MTKALEINPHDASAWYNKGIVLDNLGNTMEQITAYDKTIEIDPHDDISLVQ